MARLMGPLPEGCLPHIFAARAIGVLLRIAKRWRRRRLDNRSSTYETVEGLLLSPKLAAFPSIQSLPSSNYLASFSENCLNHRFNLLGSGWVQVSHGAQCKGLAERKYSSGPKIKPDAEGIWLDDRINRTNLAEAKRIWRLVDKEYQPIDWQLDFKSGYRWNEKTYFQDIRYGQPGVDVKVPWELARMQHLPQLALAHFSAMNGIDGFREPKAYAREYGNQVLDFIATNPPRFGVNWACTMDVSLRAASWLIAHDLFRASGASFDAAFEDEICRSIYDHGLHIVNYLEWNQDLVGNHYLANIVGLLFIAAYLPRTSETNAWLAFSVQELIKEVNHQFHQEGSNFEASTNYHRLSAEMVIYATALVLGLPDEKLLALEEYDSAFWKRRPSLETSPLSSYPIPGNRDRRSPFPKWYFDRLEKMAEFTMDFTRPDGRSVQIGDNDSGRFLRLETQTENPAKDLADHRHVVAAINALFQRKDFTAFAGNNRLETQFVANLARGTILAGRRVQNDRTTAKEIGVVAGELGKISNGNLNEKTGQGLWEGLRTFGYPGFGIFGYRSERCYLLFRCGSVGQDSWGGHAHNDQLSFELAIDGVPFVVDPGTYLYTPAKDQRNRFRSTSMHNTLSLPDREQNPWRKGRAGLFQLKEHSTARVIEFNETRFIGEHSGFGCAHRRTVEIGSQGLVGQDECSAPGGKSISFHLSPDVQVIKIEGCSVECEGKNGTRASFKSKECVWAIIDSDYSPAYGEIEPTKTLRLSTEKAKISWLIELLHSPDLGASLKWVGR